MESERERTLRQVLLELWHGRWLVFLGVSCGLVSAAAVIVFVNPVYQVEALVAPVEDSENSMFSNFQGQLGGLAAIVGLDASGAGASRSTEAIATLESRRFVEQFIRQYDLLPALFPNEWDAAAAEWRSGDIDAQPSLWDGYRKFTEDVLRVGMDAKSGLITLRVTWQDPETAATWASDLIYLINREMRDRVIAEAQKSIEFLNEELERTNAVEIRQSIYNILETQIRRIMLANVQSEYAFRVIDPPLPPDEDGYSWPRARILLPLGLLAGFALGCASVLIRLGFR